MAKEQDGDLRLMIVHKSLVHEVRELGRLRGVEASAVRSISKCLEQLGLKKITDIRHCSSCGKLNCSSIEGCPECEYYDDF